MSRDAHFKAGHRIERCRNESLRRISEVQHPGELKPGQCLCHNSHIHFHSHLCCGSSRLVAECSLHLHHQSSLFQPFENGVWQPSIIIIIWPYSRWHWPEIHVKKWYKAAPLALFTWLHIHLCLSLQLLKEQHSVNSRLKCWSVARDQNFLIFGP